MIHNHEVDGSSPPRATSNDNPASLQKLAGLSFLFPRFHSLGVSGGTLSGKDMWAADKDKLAKKRLIPIMTRAISKRIIIFAAELLS